MGDRMAPREPSNEHCDWRRISEGLDHRILWRRTIRGPDPLQRHAVEGGTGEGFCIAMIRHVDDQAFFALNGDPDC